MLRFLSNYLFQNENQPENDPTTISNSEQQGPKCNDDLKESGGGPTCSDNKDEFMDFVEGERGGESDEEDDWVLIEEGHNKAKKQVEVETLQEQPVSLVAAPSEEGCEKQEKPDDNEEDEEEDDEEEDEEVEQGLLWENKLIEHPSMSVYVDLATSINSNGVNSCVSLSSIAPATSPGESVIVIEGHDEDSDDDEDDEDMDILEVVQPEVIAPLQESSHVVEDPVSDMENNNNYVKTKSFPVNPPANTPAAALLQNGRRKKGHYPCPSSNSSQMPRRTHLRSSGGNTRNNQTFQMISSNSWTPNNPLGGQNPDNMHDSMKRKRPSNNTSSGAGNATASACGIAIVGGAGAPNPTPSSIINKNLKLVEVFPTAAPSVKRRQRNSPPQKGCTHPKGHFLQESRRRQDLQNSNKRSYVNNDRRSAQQRRVQKGAAAGGARSK